MEGVEGDGFTVMFSTSPPWFSRLLKVESSQEMLFSLVCIMLACSPEDVASKTGKFLLFLAAC